MANFLTLLSLACVVVSCLAGNSRSRRQAQGSGQCSNQPDGTFTVEDGTCSSFYSCLNGNFMGVENCPGRLLFDQNQGSCQRVVSGCPQDPANQICAAARNPGNPDEAFKVAHSDFCNLFFTCENDYALDTCEVCGNGTYFSESAGMCAALTPGLQPQECQGKQTVLDADKTVMKLKDNCHLFDKGLFEQLLNRYFAGGNGRAQQVNQRQFGRK